MTTGYTQTIIDGEITSFPEFAKLCSRAFGALIDFRDFPLNYPFPTYIYPNTDYFDQKLGELKVRLKFLLYGPVSAKKLEWYTCGQTALNDWVNLKAKTEKKEVRILRMLKEVNAWNPPSLDHTYLKKFMIQQLESTYDYEIHDHKRPELESYKDWFKRQVDLVRRDIEYYVKETNKKIEITHEKNEWIKALLTSIGE